MSKNRGRLLSKTPKFFTTKNLEIFYSESARHQKELPKKLYSNGLAFLRLEVNFPAMDVSSWNIKV